MDELGTALERARHTIDPGWDAAHTAQAQRAFHARLERRRRARIAAIVALPVAAAAVIALAWPRPAPLAEVHEGSIHFWDGSSAVPVDGTSALRAIEVTHQRIEVAVESGAGHFEVTPDLAERAFLVRSRDVTVRVVGTAFTVAAEGERTRVTVDHGRVEVTWTGGHALLEDGEARLFPPAEVEAPVAPVEAEPVEPTEIEPTETEPTETDEVEATEPPTEPAANNRWRRLAERGEFGEAFDALDGAVVRDRPEELLLAADAARLSGHPRESLPYFQRVLRDHPGDPRAPLAAFQMGRVLLSDLGRPRDAAAAFARARSAGDASMAEDALAREVEAWAAAGEAERARTRAEEYLARFPSGRRAVAVRRFGGLE